MLPIIIILSTIIALYLGYKYYKLRTRFIVLQKQQSQNKVSDQFVLTSNITHDRLTEMEDRIDALPNKVLESINGSISNQKGKLAELIAYVNLKAGYDKVIPLGNIVDFIGIRFPTENDPGTFDFIDVKNGKSARLSEDQKQLQKLIQSQSIQFLKIKITTDNVADLPKDSNTGTDSNI
jgi:predicted Holliday junction resolvase-like endonuclease